MKGSVSGGPEGEGAGSVIGGRWTGAGSVSGLPGGFGAGSVRGVFIAPLT